MKIEIIETDENQLLDRKDIKFKIMQTGATPSEKDVLKELAKTLKIDSTHIIIDAIHQRYSALECDGLAKVFKKPVREKTEEKKEEPKAEAPVAEEKKAETAEEPKVEEKKEEPKAEEKKAETAKKE
ncbi:MAG: 30S ribosomal protein S24e [Nanohaloarchaea archaeon]|nr:30S ribosomal protein S24e [Candidatus Nanohaloarchaea archaeon]